MEHGHPRAALVLPGGGARNAYQVGVLQALADGLAGWRQPFPIICGSSAGALNVAFLACHGDDFHHAVQALTQIWEGLEVNQVFRNDSFASLRSAAAWLWQLGRAHNVAEQPPSLFDSQPLRTLLQTHLSMQDMREHLLQDKLHAVSVQTSRYDDSHAVTFFEGQPCCKPWRRKRRAGLSTALDIEHLMASSSIPLVFPAVRLDQQYYGDGSLRQSAPLSAPLHLGADRIVVISVGNVRAVPSPTYPGFGFLMAHMFDAMFNERIEADIERMGLINHLLRQCQGPVYTDGGRRLRPAKVVLIQPGTDLSQRVAPHIRRFPREMSLLLRVLGAHRAEGRDIASYLLFDGAFARAMMEVGYADGYRALPAVRTLLETEH